MELTLLVKSILGLCVLLVVLVFILYLPAKETKKKRKINKKILQKEKIDFTLEHLRTIVKNPNATAKEIQSALELVIKYHGKMHAKLGLRPHPESDIYMDILFKAARHKNIDTKTLIWFNKELEKRNPEYKKEINDALMRGLNSRGL